MLTGAAWGPLSVVKSLSVPFQIRISPLSQLQASIFLSGCHANAVTCETGWTGKETSFKGSPLNN